jgi:hypothetical protein
MQKDFLMFHSENTLEFHGLDAYNRVNQIRLTWLTPQSGKNQEFTGAF